MFSLTLEVVSNNSFPEFLVYVAASCTGFHLKRFHIANSSQAELKVKLAVTSNTVLVLRFHMHEL